MTDSKTDRCGYEKTTDGEPCELPASRSDGRCHIHTEAEDRAPGGRPSLLEDHREEILEAAREGMSLKGCARLAGVTEQTLHNWLNDNEEFFESLKRARGEGELKLLRNAEDSGSRFLLERSYDYTKTERHEHTGAGGGPIEVEFHEEVVPTPYSERNGDLEVEAVDSTAPEPGEGEK